MVEESILIKASIQTVYDCIVDFEAYPKFLPETKSVKIGWCDDKQMEVTFKVNLIKEITYTLHFEFDPPRGVYWKLKNGDFMKINTGSWVLKEKGEAATHAAYSIEVGFGLWVPNAVTQVLVEKSLPLTLKRFKKRSEELSRKR